MGSGNSTLSDEREEEVFLILKNKYEELKTQGVSDHDSMQTLKELYKTLTGEDPSSKSWSKGFDFGTKSEVAVYELGDVVQVKAKNCHIFYEAVVINITDSHIDVEYSEDMEDGSPSIEEGIEKTSSRLRMVQRWDKLERGDTVKVKIGYMGYEGKVVDAGPNGQMLIDFGKQDDGSNLRELHAADHCVKVFSERLAHKHYWDHAITCIRRELRGTKAFIESKQDLHESKA